MGVIAALLEEYTNRRWIFWMRNENNDTVLGTRGALKQPRH